MKSSVQEILPIIGTSMDGGFYAGRIRIDGQLFALIVAPKEAGERVDVEWINDYKDVPEATSYFNGLTNTAAMAKSGSSLAQWAQSLRIAGHDDWYLPSQDELEIIYRNLKPTAQKNTGYARSGINLSAAEPTRPYTLQCPRKTQTEAFMKGNDQAFEAAWYWSSTQHASYSYYAWGQDFGSGDQINHNKSFDGRARAVRRLAI